jgi:peptidoglycan hydrolase-like protein with peptidoglycan-binding domain
VKKIQRVVGARADGIYGRHTKAAVMRWQKRHHYRVNGIVTAATRRAMHI